MFSNYLLSSIRNLYHNKGYFLLNIIGLSLGLTFALVIFFHMNIELSYDKHFPDHDRIFRVTQESQMGHHWAVISPPMAENLQANIPEIIEAARFYNLDPTTVMIQDENGSMNRFLIERGFFADSTVLTMFGFRVISGNRNTALTHPNSIVLTFSLATTLFGNENALGREVLNERGTARTVTAVIEDPPFNSHIQFAYLRPMVELETYFQENNLQDWWNSRGWMHFYTYVKLDENASIDAVEAKMFDYKRSYWGEDGQQSFEEVDAITLHFQPISDIHLIPHLVQDMTQQSSSLYVYIFGGVAILILVLASVNYVNISLALALKRVREIGMRKIIGALRRDVIIQCLIESALMILLAMIIALAVLTMALPFYNNVSGYSLEVMDVLAFSNLPILIGTLLVVFLLSGIYPAIYISGFSPMDTLRNIRSPKSKVTMIRKGLIILQFAASVFMIFSTIVIFSQVQYFLKKDLGFDREMLVVYRLYGELIPGVYQDFNSFRAELLRDPDILSVTSISNLPNEHYSVESIIPDGAPEDFDGPSVRYMRVDEEFLSTFRIEVADGRDFSMVNRDSMIYMINEAAVEALQLENPVGQFATNPVRGTRCEIIGVVKDFHFSSLHGEVEPLVIEYNPQWTQYIVARITDTSAMQTIENTLNTIKPDQIFVSFFLEDVLNDLYRSEQVLDSVFKVFGALAVIISCLGLFGMATLTAASKTKEIGVRKVLGATNQGVFFLVTSSFMKWILIANVIALPLSWWAMRSWLDNFAYHIDIHIAMFLLTTFISFLIAILSVSYQTIRISNTNPVNVLRQE